MRADVRVKLDGLPAPHVTIGASETPYGIPCRQPAGTDHPDLHQSSARRARGDVARGERGDAGDAVVAGAGHHPVEHRHGGRRRGADLPGHGHAHVFRAHARGREPDSDQEGDSRGGGRGDAARQAAAELGGFDHREKQRQQSRRRDAGDSLRAVGRGRDRSEADPQGRRLREQEYSVFRAVQSRPPGPRGPQSGRRAQVHSARGVAGAGTGLRAGRAGRVHRQRSRARVRAGEAATVPHAGRRESESASWRSSKRRSWTRPTGSAWARWDSAGRRR